MLCIMIFCDLIFTLCLLFKIHGNHTARLETVCICFFSFETLCIEKQIANEIKIDWNSLGNIPVFSYSW